MLTYYLNGPMHLYAVNVIRDDLLTKSILKEYSLKSILTSISPYSGTQRALKSIDFKEYCLKSILKPIYP